MIIHSHKQTLFFSVKKQSWKSREKNTKEKKNVFDRFHQSFSFIEKSSKKCSKTLKNQYLNPSLRKMLVQIISDERHIFLWYWAIYFRFQNWTRIFFQVDVFLWFSFKKPNQFGNNFYVYHKKYLGYKM